MEFVGLLLYQKILIHEKANSIYMLIPDSGI